MRRFAKPLYGLTPVPRVRIPASPPVSLNCREIPPAFTPKYAKNARISRLFLEQTGLQRTDCLGSGWRPFALFSEADIEQSDSGEMLRSNILRSQTKCFAKRDLTFVCLWNRASLLFFN